MILEHFFRCKLHAEEDHALPPNEARRIGRSGVLLRMLAAVAGGGLLAAALPPLNWSWLALFPLAALALIVSDRSPAAAAGYGWLWGMGWALPAFFWLREIHPAVPFLIAPVLALWPMVWAATVPFLLRQLAAPVAARLAGEAAVAAHPPGAGRLLLLSAALAAWWVLLEFSRSTMLPWNNLAVTLWRFPRLLAPAAWTGAYGLGFLLAWLNLALAFGLHFRAGGFRRFLPLLTAAALAALTVAAAHAVRRTPPAETVPIRIGAAQGDVSQRRNADTMQAAEALDIYLELTRSLLAETPRPELIVWPETAVPYALKSNHPVSARYRRELGRLLQPGVSMLIGTVDFAVRPAGAAGTPGITNSALLFDGAGREVGRYDKSHRVPFGEYIPFRAWLPASLVRTIDMNRDLTPGTGYEPLEVAPGVRAGVAICFESVFAYIAREEARRGANLLLVVSNDAWYPTSSEPEQHLANAVFRSVETGLYTLRCGNNGGTLTVTPDGSVGTVLEVSGAERPEIRRGRGTAVFSLAVPRAPEPTFYTRHGEWFPGLCALLAAGAAAAVLRNWFAFRREITRLGEKGIPS